LIVANELKHDIDDMIEISPFRKKLGTLSEQKYICESSGK